MTDIVTIGVDLAKNVFAVHGVSATGKLNRLHGPPKENKHLLRDGLKGLQPHIRAVGAVVAAAHDGYSRLGFLSPGCTHGTGDSSEFPNPG
ncbi:hypothetical protein LJR038_002604 [Acidovorax sp. LjRoot38]|uniref:hypothetical protein n=1 Tax=Acidovorax sp. LjRoot38 TaxID=3342327 RepID=UPI003ED0FBAB